MSKLESLLKEAHSTDIETKTMAVMELGELGDPQAFDTVLTILTTEKAESSKGNAVWDDELLLECIFTLGALGDKRAISPLRAILTTDDNSSAKEKAGEALGKLGDHSFLLNCLSHVDEFTRLGALMGLYIIDRGDPALFTLASEALQDGSVEVISFAVAVLEEIGDPRAIPLITPFTKKHEFNVNGVALSELSTTAIERIERRV